MRLRPASRITSVSASEPGSGASPGTSELMTVSIVAEGALSFLGLSVPAPNPSWGGTIAEGREQLEEAPHISLVPAAIMFFTVLSFNLVGDTLRSRIADVRESAL